MLADREVVKRITIEAKIEFWRCVIQQATKSGPTPPTLYQRR